MSDEFYTVAELARLFGKTPQTIHNWIDDGRFPGKFTVGEGGGKITLIPKSDVEAARKEEADKHIKELNRLGFQAVPA